MSSVKFNNSDAQFFNTLRERIDSYFSKNNIQTTGDFRLYLKTIILMTSLIACYTLLIYFFHSSFRMAIAGPLLSDGGNHCRCRLQCHARRRTWKLFET